MTRTRTLLNFLSATLIALSMPLAAEISANSHRPETLHSNGIIKVPVGSQSQQMRQSLSLPEHGQSMDEVRKMLGNASQTETIGEPPITRWYYPEQQLTVYFEGKRVLRSVIQNIAENR